MGNSLSLDDRVSRDQDNAYDVQKHTVESVKNGPPTGKVTKTIIQSYESQKSLSEIPFNAMVEANAETVTEEYKALWYVSEVISDTQVLNINEKRIIILPWTHPGVQLALNGTLNDYYDINRSGLRLIGVEPIARAKFKAVLPSISGLYEPGGAVRYEKDKEIVTGLKAVKLDMTTDQVKAFISKMDGMMIVTGAPGSGKTTVAFQRVRFLYDQQEDRKDEFKKVKYSPELTKIFLANQNMIAYSKKLLVDELNIPEKVVAQVPQFIKEYLQNLWPYKHKARVRTRHIPYLEERARQAFFGLCTVKHLRECWETYEQQIIDRLSQVFQSEWYILLKGKDSSIDETLRDLANILLDYSGKTKVTKSPLSSKLRMDELYQNAGRAYETLRDLLESEIKEKFDTAFQQWLFWVYDPLNSISTYFKNGLYEGGLRINSATASRIRENEVIENMKQDWQDRQYGPEEEPWLAWLLRFALPEVYQWQDRFREIPWALPYTEASDEQRYTHIVIDEAQDLSAPEASLLSSFVDPDGAVTVSADYRQIVSPVHGITDGSTFKITNTLKDKTAVNPYLFSKNMRQSRSISRFLMAFYQKAFGELPAFGSNDRFDDIKPQLIISSLNEYAIRIKQVFNVLNRSDKISSIALIQINEDEEAMKRLRLSLENEGVPLAPVWEHSGFSKGLLTSSVERIKGLEFDACIVLGLDDIERASLNFSTNRAYVAVSRPSRRLFMICEEFPKLLQKISQDLFEVRRPAK